MKRFKSPLVQQVDRLWASVCAHDKDRLMTKDEFGAWLVVQTSGLLVFRCAFCNALTSLTDGSVDHAWPRDLGGRTEQGNLLLTCRPCNGRKGPVGDREFHEILILIEAWPRRRSSNPIEQQRLRSMGDSILKRLGQKPSFRFKEAAPRARLIRRRF